jgi:hypothetical protein
MVCLDGELIKGKDALSYIDDRDDLQTNAIFSRRERFWLRLARKCMPWFRPMRTMHKAIDSSKRLIHRAQAVIEASRSSAKQRPLRTARRLHQASRWLMDAADQLHRATDAMLEAKASLAFAPKGERFAPERLAEDAKRMLDAAGDLNMATIELNVAVANALLLERAGYVTDSRPVITVPPPGIRLSQDDSPSLSLRRRRSVLATIEDAVRRVCRGRAPPMVSLCPL